MKRELLKRNMTMTRLLSMGLLVIALAGCKSSNSNDYPNIVLIFTDQQNARMMSAAGNSMVHTPHMDVIASQGMRFSQAYCSSPVCGPSRSSLITGFMPHTTGVVWNGDSPVEDIMENNIGFLLRAQGYHTVWAGKWHLPESYPQQAGSKHGDTPGFDMLPFWDQDQKHWFLGYDTDPPLTDAVVEYLDNYRDQKPLFLAVSYHNPHDICFYPRKSGWFSNEDSLLEIRNWGIKHRLPDVIGLHPDSFTVLPPLPDNHDIGEHEPSFVHTKRIHPQRYGAETHMSYQFSDMEWRGYLNAYARLTEMVDTEVGTILEALERNGLDKNTLIIFTSDHGDGAASHKWSAKNSLYKESAMIPFVISWPDHIPANRTNHKDLVSIADVVPTILDLLGVQTDLDFHGRSLTPFFEEDGESPRDFIVVELADDKYSRERMGRLVRSERYSYGIYSNGEEQLYDIIDDPGEMKNLAGQEAYRETVDLHKKMLLTWMEETDDPFRQHLVHEDQ